MHIRKVSAALLALLLVTVALLTGCATKTEAPPANKPADAPKPPVKVAVVTSRSGAFESWGTAELRGLEIGIEYATGGKNEVNGRKIEVKVYDDQGKPEVGKAMAEQAITEWKADIIQGTVSSGIATQIIPVIDQYKKIFLVEPAAADNITGKDFSKYVFRTGSTTSQDALAGAVGATKLGKKIAQLAPDYQWGHDSADAWAALMKPAGAEVLPTVYAPQDTTDFTPYFQKILALKPEVLVVSWSGANSAKLFQQAGEQGVYQKVKVTGGIADFASMKQMGTQAAGMSGMVKYFYALPKTEANDFLVKRHKEKFNEYPDLFTGGGMAAGIAIVEGLKKTNGEADGDKLVAAMEGMSFKGPKGDYTFRKEDHQALQVMYVVELAMNPGFDFPTPKLVKELTPQETAPPIANKK